MNFKFSPRELICGIEPGRASSGFSTDRDVRHSLKASPSLFLLLFAVSDRKEALPIMLNAHRVIHAKAPC